MLSNYHTLFSLTGSLHTSLQNRRISEIYTQTADEMVMAFGTGEPSLVFCCCADIVSVFLHGRATRARHNSAGLLQEAWGELILGAAIHPSDRVITFPLASGSRIVLQFFGAQSNAFYADSSGRIRDAFRKPRRHIGEILPNNSTELVFDFTLLAEKLRNAPSSPAAGILKSAFPTLGTTLIREILFRCSVPVAAAVGDLRPSEIEAIPLEVRRILGEIASPSVRLYYDSKGIPSVFSLIPLRHLAECEERTFVDIHEAVRTFVFRRRAGATLASDIGGLRSTLQRVAEKLRRTQRAIDADTRKSERAEEYERCGQLLMANLPAVGKGDTQVDLDGVSIRIDPRLTPVQNAQRYFDRAKRARAAAAEGNARPAAISERLAAVDRLLEEIDLVTSPDELQLFRKTHEQLLAVFGLTPESRARAELPFRLFRVEGGFDVWAGKSRSNNELLTMKHARANDLWFHARGAGGSHVVLKTGTGKGTPGKRALEQAAAIAAYYSKLKGSALVPVAMTERKYVRKPRGASPGTVVLEREKTLFVRPQLPPDEPDSDVRTAKHQQE